MPTFIPDSHRQQLATLLGIAGARMADDPDDATVHVIHHGNADWTAEYLGALQGDPIWRLTGPAHPGGITLDKYGIVTAVTTA
jgi:hypothetical protein